MSHRGHRIHANASSNGAAYRGIPIAAEPVHTVHCKIFNQQKPVDQVKELFDHTKAECFACGGDRTVYKCQGWN